MVQLSLNTNSQKDLNMCLDIVYSIPQRIGIPTNARWCISPIGVLDVEPEHVQPIRRNGYGVEVLSTSTIYYINTNLW